MDIVHEMDMKYSGAGAVACPNEGVKVTLEQSKVSSDYHGKMGVHASGAFLVCGWCGARTPTARI